MMFVHIAAGTISLVSGAAAMIFRKGSDRHRQSGNVFVASMGVLAATGAWIAFTNGGVLSGCMGLLTLYLLTTGWLTGRRRDGEARTSDIVLLAAGLGIAATLGYYGLQALNSGEAIGGFPAPAYFVFGALALTFAAGDVTMLMRGGVAGARRIARHLRRMCVAWFISTGSFFLGQQQVMPEWIRGSVILIVLGILPLLLLAYWQFRYRRVVIA